MESFNFGAFDPTIGARLANIPQEAQKQQTANMLQAMQMQGAMREGQMSQMKIDEMLAERKEIDTFAANLKARGYTQGSKGFFTELASSRNLTRMQQGFEGLRRLEEQDRFDAYQQRQSAKRTNALAPSELVNAMLGAPTLADLQEEARALSMLKDPRAKDELAFVRDQIKQLTQPRVVGPSGSVVVGGVPTYTAAAAPSPTARMQAELDALPPNDPRRPALEAQINSALITQQQGADRLKQGWGQLNVAQRNAATSEARLKLAQDAPKLGLTDPEDIDRVAKAVASGRLPIDRLNGGTALLFAKLLKATPDLDFTKLNVAQAGDKASAVSNAKIASRQTLTDVDATQAENIARGNLAPATGPNAGKIMNEVLKLNPEYNSRDFGLQTAAEKSFNTGKQGDKARSLNVAVSHLATLDIAAAALNSGEVRMFNQFKQAWQRETGKTAPTNFNAVRELVADEIVAAVVPGVGALADRKALKETILARSSRAQLQGVIKEYKELLGGQLGGLEKQYNASTGKTDFRQRYLTPEAIAALTPEQNALPAGAARPAGVGPNWTFETDAAGNSAWVSPDRKSFKEAQ